MLTFLTSIELNSLTTARSFLSKKLRQNTLNGMNAGLYRAEKKERGLLARLFMIGGLLVFVVQSKLVTVTGAL